MDLLYTPGLRGHEIKVYGWGFPCLDYSFEVLVSWSCNLSLYNVFPTLSCDASITCWLINYTVPTLLLLSLCHSAVTWSFVWEVLTPLNLYVQVPKIGSKWSRPQKIKLSLLSRPTSFSSLCARLFSSTHGIFVQLVSILCSYCKSYFWTWLWYKTHVLYIIPCDNFVICTS